MLSNMEMLERAAAALAPLSRPVLFVGGVTIPLYLDPFGASQARTTLDVDCVVAAASWAEFADIEDELRGLGLQNDLSPGAPLCRWVANGVRVDVMPTDEAILGFSNHFYQLGLSCARSIVLRSGRTIQILRPAHLVASKIAAFESRGASDPFLSKDLEDIIALLDGARGLVEEVEQSEPETRQFVRAWAERFLRHPDAASLIEGAVPRPTTQDRLRVVRERLVVLSGGQGE